jgi:hypothetical protein
MVGKTTSNNGEIGYRIESANDGTDYFVWSQLGVIQSGTGDVTGQPINTGVWTNLVITKSGSNANLYKNGVLIGSNTNLSALVNCSNNLLFGACNDQGLIVSHFQGKLDDIGIWDRALSQSEITVLYESCNINPSISPSPALVAIGASTQFITPTIAGGIYQWQTNPANTGWINSPSNSTYSGGTTNNLAVNNVQLANHQQPFRVIVTSGSCIDTSLVASIEISDTCVVTVNDTVFTAVTDTLIINTSISSVPTNVQNTIKIYPNPASDYITIDNGNYTVMFGYSIMIENNSGQQVFQSEINQAQFYLDLSSWTGNGLYFIHLIDPQGSTITIRKIVLQ